jgi:hypothetical protein
MLKLQKKWKFEVYILNLHQNVEILFIDFKEFMFLFILISNFCWLFTWIETCLLLSKCRLSSIEWLPNYIETRKAYTCNWGTIFGLKMLRGQLFCHHYKVTCEQHPASFQPFWYFSSGMAAGLVKHDLGAALTLATLLWPTIFSNAKKSCHLKGGSWKAAFLKPPAEKDGTQLATIQSDS